MTSWLKDVHYRLFREKQALLDEIVRKNERIERLENEVYRFAIRMRSIHRKSGAGYAGGNAPEGSDG